MTVFDKLDTIRAKVDAKRNEPLFSEEIRSLENRYQTTVTSEQNNLLRVMAKLICYSNNAPSDKVTQLIDSRKFERIFHDFELTALAKEDPENIIDSEWHNLTAIRFKKKIPAIIRCAKLLQDGGSTTIESIYSGNKLPVELKTESDIDNFWLCFDLMLAKYEKQEMPHFKNMTTLLHLLLHLGFPCVKPDLIVMKVAALIGLVPTRENLNTYRPVERKIVVKTIQQYCLSRNIKPAVMDLYFLVFGGQKDSLKYVNGFIPFSI